MGVSQSLQEVGELYSQNLAQNGAVSQAVGWNSPESQEVRFRELTKVVDRATGSFSVNDYGCGYGAHLEYLLGRGMTVSEYNGYDISAPMLAATRERQGQFDGALNLFQSNEISSEADFTFVSGTFNVRFKADDAEWTEHILSCLDRINQHSRRGFSFNLLSTYVDWKEPHLFYGDPRFFFDHCKTRYSRFVTLIHDYPLYEWTILVRKDVL